VRKKQGVMMHGLHSGRHFASLVATALVICLVQVTESASGSSRAFIWRAPQSMSVARQMTLTG